MILLARTTSILVSTLCAGLVMTGCSSSETSASGGAVGDTRTECAAYCANQANTGCRNRLPADSCQENCVGLPAQFPSCTSAWNALNHCMAHAPLTCNQTGDPAVGQECFDQVNAFEGCFDALDGGK